MSRIKVFVTSDCVWKSEGGSIVHFGRMSASLSRLPCVGEKIHLKGWGVLLVSDVTHFVDVSGAIEHDGEVVVSFPSPNGDMG